MRLSSIISLIGLRTLNPGYQFCRISLTTQSEALPYQSRMKKVAYRLVYKSMSWIYFSQLRFPFPRYVEIVPR